MIEMIDNGSAPEIESHNLANLGLNATAEQKLKVVNYVKALGTHENLSGNIPLKNKVAQVGTYIILSHKPITE